MTAMPMTSPDRIELSPAQRGELTGVLRAGRIGEVRVVQVAVTYFNIDPANVRNRVDIGGGARRAEERDLVVRGILLLDLLGLAAVARLLVGRRVVPAGRLGK